MQNHLKNQVSPYLLQHVDNPVDWYPWCKEAFERAKAEDKPIFLSIGYSTCHWCHVMAHESFEDEEIAEILNQHFISIKVDKEERPDIDSIYMAVCQAVTGSGGWPTTIFLTPEQKPFFAGTYFPKTSRYGQIGLKELLLAVHDMWESNRNSLLESSEQIMSYLDETDYYEGEADEQMIHSAVRHYKRSFDETFGGFGSAPKFPTPHNLLFLMTYYEKSRDKEALEMAEKTLLQMYRGGMFDHIGGGFSRYSTDRYFLVPHFEKMLYDNALLIMAYCRAYQITKNPIYFNIAEKTASYVLREMTAPEGGFYSAQDADSEGEEGKYYVFEPSEIIDILGEELGKEFNQYFDITDRGNFEGKSIPNLLKNQNVSGKFDKHLQAVYEYRKKRYSLHLDDKILTAWNGLMIVAMCHLYRVSKNKNYLEEAIKAQEFIEDKLCEKDTLYVSYREGKRGEKGFLDEYANEIFALIALYEATFDTNYLERAQNFCDKVLSDFYDEKQGGFFLYGKENEQLIIRPKGSNSGAVPSGNSLMAYNFVQLYFLTDEKKFEELAKRQIEFVTKEAGRYPAGYTMFLMALSDYMDPPEKITVVLKDKEELADLPCRMPLNAIVRVLDKATDEYPLKNDKTTFYVCQGHVCKPPTNDFTVE
ncbi:MAG: thioredoxin domain-containing protein [Tyzzerella sp.]|nr:thioredoxin domain-containing protein [Tyzzerella sp.]